MEKTVSPVNPVDDALATLIAEALKFDYTRYTVGVDPGAEGALTVLATRPGWKPLIAVVDIPSYRREIDKKTKAGKAAYRSEFDYPALGDIVRQLDPVSARRIRFTIEKFQIMVKHPGAKAGPGKAHAGGAMSAAKTAEGGRMFRLWCAYRRIQYAEVHPATWKAYYKIRGEGAKEHARAKARELYPSLTTLSRKSDHNRAEAVLIANYAFATASD